MRDGDLDLAQEYFDRAHAADPTFFQALHNLGIVESRRQNWDVAAGWFRRALRSKPNDASSYRHLSLALIRLEEFVEAADACKRGIAFFPDDGQLHANAISSFREIADHEELGAEHRRWTKRHPEDDAGWINYSRWLFGQEGRDAAVRLLTDAAEKVVDDTRIRRELERIR